MPVSDHVKVLVAMLIVHLLFSVYNVILISLGKTSNMNLVLLIFLRISITAPGSLVVAIMMEGVKNYQISKRDVLFFGVFGTFATSLSPLSFAATTYLVSASFSTIMSQTITIFTAFFSIIMRIEPFPSYSSKKGLMRILGIVLGLISAVGVIAGGQAAFKGEKQLKNWIMGIVISLTNVMISAMYFVLQMKWYFNNEESPLKDKPLTLHAASCIFGAVVFSPSAIYIAARNEIVSSMTWKSAVLVTYSAFICSIFCYGTMSWCTKVSGPSFVSASWPSQVLITFLMTSVILEERMTYVQYVFCGVIVIAVILVVLSAPSKRCRELPVQVPSSLITEEDPRN